jgi:CheY-like chemotaxis protein
MSRILLADDSPHAQRMGERILRDEGFEVVTVTDGETALLRLADVDPDLVLADVSLPRQSGYDICRNIKESRRHSHVRVILTAGLLESFDDQRAAVVRCDGVLKKPFESSALIGMIKPLVEAAARDKPNRGPAPPEVRSGPVPVRVLSQPAAPPLAGANDIDVERVRAAVTLALDAALPSMIDKITERVLIALGH